MINHYETLGVDRKATKEQIKRAFRRLVKLVHPDKNPENKEEAERRFRTLVAAYETLMDDRKRAIYDRMLLQHERRARFFARRAASTPQPKRSKFDIILTELLSGEVEEAIRIYEELLAEEKDLDLTRHMNYVDGRDCEFLLAEAYQSLGRYEEAAKLYERSLEHERHRPYFRKFTDEVISRLKKIYSHLLVQSRVPELSLIYIQRLILLGGSKRQIAWAYKKLAELYFEFGQMDNARIILRKAFELCPRLPGSKRICRKLGMEHLL
jgi:curved DNA-binding protein CbpA